MDESSAELIFGGSQDKEDFERMFPKVSVKTTGALIPLNKGSKRQTHLEPPQTSLHKPTLIEHFHYGPKHILLYCLFYSI